MERLWLWLLTPLRDCACKQPMQGAPSVSMLQPFLPPTHFNLWTGVKKGICHGRVSCWPLLGWCDPQGSPRKQFQCSPECKSHFWDRVLYRICKGGDNLHASLAPAYPTHWFTNKDVKQNNWASLRGCRSTPCQTALSKRMQMLCFLRPTKGDYYISWGKTFPIIYTWRKLISKVTLGNLTKNFVLWWVSL